MQRITTLAFAAILFFAGAARAGAQDLLDLYRLTRIRSLSQSVEDSVLAPKPLETVGMPRGELAYWPVSSEVESSKAPAGPTIAVDRYQKVPKLGRSWFETRFAVEQWVYEGSNRLAPIDTMYTRELRSRLEAHFGSPTQTLPDLGLLNRLRLSEFVQFEYWFVVNDSIPFVVMDVNGPFERGLVVATDEPHSSILIALKDAFLQRLLDDPRRKPYADYYFEEELGSWFLTGFDGNRYFLTVVDPRRVPPGRPVVPPEKR